MQGLGPLSPGELATTVFRNITDPPTRRFPRRGAKTLGRGSKKAAATLRWSTDPTWPKRGPRRGQEDLLLLGQEEDLLLRQEEDLLTPNLWKSLRPQF